MKISDIEPEISVHMTGYSRGQKSLTMAVKLGGKSVATMDFSEYGDIPSIEWIKVDPEYRNRGLGKHMIRELQRMYPNQEIQWGYTTPEGTALYKSIPHKMIEKPEVIRKVEHLKKIKRELKKLEAKLNSLTPEEKTRWIQTVSDRWNRYHDMVSSLEHQLEYDSQTHKKIVDLGN